MAGLVLGLLSTPGVATAAPDRDTYRVLTYNVDMPGDLGGYESRYGARNTERAEEIAERLIAGDEDGDYDVVVLTEAIDVETRTTLRTELAAEFGYSLPDVGDEDVLLFSRFPIHGVPVAGSGCERINAANLCELAYHEYSAGDGGIGYVRIGNPRSDKAGDVYFTSLQEGDDRIAHQTRATQADEAASFVQTWSKAAAGGADVILAGTLNVEAGTPEHTDLVLGQNGFGRVKLGDTWREHGSQSDPGFTVDSDRNAVAGAAGADRRERTDYVLFRHSAEVRSCVQHGTLERHFTGTFLHLEPKPGGTKSIVDLSDHFPLAVDIGKPLAHCGSASKEQDEGAKSKSTDGWHYGDITRFGGFQWFHFAKPGTYTFKAQLPVQQNMLLDVYESTDLSTPLKPVEGEGVLVTPPCGSTHCPVTTTVTVDTKGPFFVRLRMEDPAHAGPYGFHSQFHLGGSFEEAVYLDPFESLFQDQMTAQAGGLSTVHYRITQHALDSGLPQTLVFDVEEQTIPLRIRLFTEADLVNPEHETSTNAPSISLTVPAAGSKIPAGEQDLFFTVDAGCLNPCATPTTYRVEWSTSLRRLDVRRLVVIDQNDDPEPTDNDEIRCEVRVDFSTAHQMDFGTTAEGDSRYFDDPFRDITFDQEVQLECFELDESAATDDTTHVRKVLAGEIPTGDTLAFERDYAVHNDGSPDPTDTNGIYRIEFEGTG
ncbi:hypothetical protein [Saccharothrix sp. HUAS TT1]|uniref:hypothetical protein n=1 Tax=unclassified Saccharothrix TaxID=2593673 RepID=UPI00345B4D36